MGRQLVLVLYPSVPQPPARGALPVDRPQRLQLRQRADRIGFSLLARRARIAAGGIPCARHDLSRDRRCPRCEGSLTMRRPLRRVRRLVRRLRRRERPIILMYHRVASPACDPWELAVQPAIFDAQIGTLTTMRRVVPLGWLLRELARGRVPARTPAGNFDYRYSRLPPETQPGLHPPGWPATTVLHPG